MTTLSHNPNGAACALNLRFIGIGTELHHQYPVGRSPFVLPPQAAHHPSPCPVDTHQIQSSKEKQLQWGQTYDKVTPHIPSLGAMILLKKSVPVLRISHAMLRRRYHPLPPAHKPPEAFQPAPVFWVPAILELPEYSTPAVHDSATPSGKPFHPLYGEEPAPPAEPKIARLRQRVRARKFEVRGSLPSRLALEHHQLPGLVCNGCMWRCRRMRQINAHGTHLCKRRSPGISYPSKQPSQQSKEPHVDNISVDPNVMMKGCQTAEAYRLHNGFRRESLFEWPA